MEWQSSKFLIDEITKILLDKKMVDSYMAQSFAGFAAAWVSHKVWRGQKFPSFLLVLHKRAIEAE